MPSDDPAIDPKLVLDYLDREMAALQIPAVFSTSSLTIALGLVLGFGKEAPTVSWTEADILGLLASAIFLLASAGFFFAQRSRLSWLYGRISIAASGYGNEWKLPDELKEAESWETWIQYRWAWKMMLAAFMEAMSVAFLYLLRSHIPAYQAGHPSISLLLAPWIARGVDVLIVMLFLWGAFQTYVFHKWPYHRNNPIRSFLRYVKRSARRSITKHRSIRSTGESEYL